MLGEGFSKSEIEEKLSSMGSFLQIEYLTKLVKEKMPTDVKKFAYFKLIKVYEKMNMLNNAAKTFENLAIIAIAFSEKIKYYIKATELYIKAGFFDKADYSMKKAMNEANAVERQEIYFVVKEFYKRVAEDYKKDLKRNHAVKIYEKLLEMNISDIERKEIKEILMELYEKLGRLKEFYSMKRFEEREFF